MSLSNKKTFKIFSNGERAGSLVSFAIVLPFLLTLFLATAQFGPLMRDYQVASMLSRDAASAAFRVCAFRPTTAEIQTCLRNNVYSNLIDFKNDFLDEDAGIIISIYQYVPPAGGMPASIELRGAYPLDSNSSPGDMGFPSRFSPGLASEFPLLSINSRNPTIAIAEVFHRFVPLRVIGNESFNNLRTIYEVTIY